MTKLRIEWESINNCFSISNPTNWFETIVEKYNDDGRNAHNLFYLEKKFSELEKFCGNLLNVNAFKVALFFQYLFYDPRDGDFFNKNLESFKSFASDVRILEDSDLYKAVNKLLETASTSSTEEHKIEGVYGQEDVHYFLDLDMVALGGDPESYAKYAKDIAQEYNFLDDTSYRNLRKRVLQSFLLIPNIFATKLFRNEYERQARQNIQNELDELRSS